MTLHDYGYLPPEFLKSYPVSEGNFQIYTLPRSLAFFHGFFRVGAQSIVMQISFVMLIFLLLSNQYFGGRGGKLLEGKASTQPNNVSKHRNELFSKETLTNSCTVCHIITINMLKTSKLGLISWTKDK